MNRFREKRPAKHSRKVMQNSKTENIIGTILGAVFAAALIIVIFFTSMEITIYAEVPESFVRECEKYGALDDVGISRGDMAAVTVDMFEYLRDNRDTLEDITATINGQPDTPFFNEKECLHMADCKKLFTGGYRLRGICIAVCIVMLLAIFIMFRRNTGNALHCLASGILYGTIGFIGIFIILGACVAADFNRYFTLFHLIFFDNDLWLLDPTKDRLLMVMPEGYFMDCVRSIGIYFGIGMMILLAASILYLIYEKSCRNKVEKR